MMDFLWEGPASWTSYGRGLHDGLPMGRACMMDFLWDEPA